MTNWTAAASRQSLAAASGVNTSAIASKVHEGDPANCPSASSEPAVVLIFFSRGATIKDFPPAFSTATLTDLMAAASDPSSINIPTLRPAIVALKFLTIESAGDAGMSRGARATSLALGKAIPDFLARYPEIEIELILQDRVLDIASEKIDIGLRMTAVPAPDLVSIPIAKLNWLICASPQYLATSGEPHSPRDLEHHQCMNYWSAQSDDAWHLRRNEEDLKIRVRNRYRANNPEVIVDAAVEGQGIALLPLYCCREQIADGRLQPILKDWSPLTKFGHQVTAVIAPDRIGFSRNQAFLQFLKEHFGAEA